MRQDPVFSPSDFVGAFNQTIEYAYPGVIIHGELTEYRVSKGRWLHFKLRDEYATVQFFGVAQQLQHELRDGMMLQVRGFPRLHPLYGFSIQVQFVQPVGEGSIKQAADLVMQKLKKEGLFDDTRKRRVPYPPKKIGLITSIESAAYRDFIKVLTERWRGIDIEVFDVNVQGEQAVSAITKAIKTCNDAHKGALDALILTRGGGSLEDLAAFSTEQVTRAVAESAIPTVVAIGHERDVSLAELAADLRASTPSNAAELLTPNRQDVLATLTDIRRQTKYLLSALLHTQKEDIKQKSMQLTEVMTLYVARQREQIAHTKQLLGALHPDTVLERGFAVARLEDGTVLRSVKDTAEGDAVTITLKDGSIKSLVQSKQTRTKGKS